MLKLGGEVGEVSGKKLLDMAYNSGAIDVGMMAPEFAQAGKDWSFFRGVQSVSILMLCGKPL